jgi:hypothetical protein
VTDVAQHAFSTRRDMRAPLPIREILAESKIDWTFTPRLEPGEYPAYSRSARVYYDRQFKRHICAVQFDVLNSLLIDTVAKLTWYLNLGTRGRPHAGRRSNYWTAWVTANGGAPRRNDRLSPQVFLHRHATVLVADTTKDHQQNSVAEGYSVIREVLRWETGGAL